jgi:hypothetical protein
MEHVKVTLMPKGFNPDLQKVEISTFLADFSSNTHPILTKAEVDQIKQKIATRRSLIQEKQEKKHEFEDLAALISSTKSKQEELDRLASLLEQKAKPDKKKEKNLKKKKSFFAKLFG